MINKGDYHNKTNTGGIDPHFFINLRSLPGEYIHEEFMQVETQQLHEEFARCSMFCFGYYGDLHHDPVKESIGYYLNRTGKKANQLTKQEFKKLWHEYREYYFEMSNEDRIPWEASCV